MLGARRWAAGVEPHEGERIGEGFVRILPGLLEIRAGGAATVVAEYDISVSPAGPRGFLPIRRRHVERFVDAVRAALDSATEGGAA